MFCFKWGKRSGKRLRIMPGGQRQAPKKPWELRYVLLSNTTPRWTQPVSVYLLERIGSSGKVWLVCRPALDPEQETEPRFQLPGATEDDEYICFEQVDFSTLRAEDDFPLGQPGPMPDARLARRARTRGRTCWRCAHGSCVQRRVSL